MNFDGKAFVKNTTNRTFMSKHGAAYVINYELDLNTLTLATGSGDAYVSPLSLTNEQIIVAPTIKTVGRGLVPYSVYVYESEPEYDFPLYHFTGIRDDVKNDKQDFVYDNSSTYIARVQPTNIKYNPKSAIVNDCVAQESAMAFHGVSVNVHSKVEVIVPEKGTDYSDISIVVQKNSFIEFKLSDAVTNVTNLPEALIYLPGYIKGTFTQSGEYNIKIKYPDGEQILNIIVPYYERLL